MHLTKTLGAVVGGLLVIGSTAVAAGSSPAALVSDSPDAVEATFSPPATQEFPSTPERTGDLQDLSNLRSSVTNDRLVDSPEVQRAAGVAEAALATGAIDFYMAMPEVGTVLVGLSRPDGVPEAEASKFRAQQIEKIALEGGVDPDAFSDVEYLGGTEESPIVHGDSLISTGGSRCSAGAWGYNFFGTLAIPHVVTASHCFDTPDCECATHDTHPPSYITGAQWNASNADVQRMAPSGQFGEVSNLVAGGFTMIGEVAPGGPFDRAGDPICLAGAVSGHQCGSIQSVNGGCREHTGMRMGWYPSTSGDSGGTIHSATFPGVALAGIHEGRCTFWWGGAEISVKMYTFQTVARFILGLAGWYHA